MKFVFCSECGTKLIVFRKAMPSLGQIIDMVEPHTCPDEPVEVDLTPSIVPMFIGKEGKFVQKLNDLSSKASGMVGSNDLRDRRFEKDEVPVPKGIMDILDNFHEDDKG